jgi:alpha-L-fucosidase
MIPILIALSVSTDGPTIQKPDMSWWREARFGLFIHWGLYAIPAGKWGDKTHYGEWIMDTANIPIPTYEKFVSQFNPIKFDADEWVSIAKEAGMRYIVITTKHHDGFALFDSKHSDYDIMATPFKRDIMREIAEATRRQGLVPCWYHSIMDWHHPDYLPRRAWETRSAEGASFDRYFFYLKGQVEELLTKYGDIGVMWFDGEWESTWLPKYGAELLQHCRKLSPKTIVNNRVSQVRAGMEDVVGNSSLQQAVGDFGTPEQHIPATGLPGQDWETCMTIGEHWGYNAYERNWKSSTTLIRNLIDIVSKGGNYLLNVGPREDGTFPPECIERLREIGQWMKVNSDAIYGTHASPFESLTWGRCTVKVQGNQTFLFLHVFEWPENGKLVVPGIGNDVASARILGGESTSAQRVDSNIIIDLPPHPLHEAATVIELVIDGEPLVYGTPKIISPGTEFITSIPVSIIASSEKLDVRFTLDGTNPNSTSAKYEGPIRLNTDCTLKAATFDREKRVSDIAERHFKKVRPWPSIQPPIDLRPGLSLRIYSGDWNKVPDFKSLIPRTTTSSSLISHKDDTPEEYVGRVYEGYLIIEESALVEFALASDDGSRLLIDGNLVVDNDGLHSAVTKIGRAPLEKGLHKIQVEWFNKTGAAVLELTMSLDGKLHKEIPATSLKH